MLSVEHATVRFDEHVALDDVSITVGAGEIVCALGPSGSGKSTLLRAIAGLEPLTAGRVLRDGVDLAGVAPERRGFGLMFQDHALFPHRDVLDNVAFGPRMQGAGRAAAVEQARRMLGLVGLAGFEHRRIAELSGGEQQRVALARSLAPSPRLLMLDEPLGALDRHLRERLVDDLGRLFRSLGQSVLLVTHDHDEAFGLADRVAILDHGRIEQVGPPTALWRRPETEFVAEFLGWNVLVDGARRVAIRPDALHLLAPGETSGQAAADREATPATPFGVGGPFTGIVRSRMFRRDHWRVRVALDADGSPVSERSRDEQRGNEQRGNEPLVHEQAVEVVVRDREPPAPGDRVRLTVDAHGMVELP